MIDIADDLRSYLMTESGRSDDASLNEQRAIALDFYRGAPFGDEEEGRSQFITRDVAEVVDYMQISILRTIISGSRVVEFEARDEEQRDAADDATELVHWQFMRAQPGKQIIEDGLKAGLLEKTGFFKTMAEPTLVIEEGVATAQEVDEDTSIVWHQAIPDAIELVGHDELTGQAITTQLYQVRRKVDGPVRFVDMAVPNEELRINPEARSLEDASYIQHRVRKSLSWFVEVGLCDAEEAATLWSDATDATVLGNARDAGRGRRDNDSAGTALNRQVWLSEEHLRWDVDGDGIAERICVLRVGDKVLQLEEVDEHPFEGWCPFPMPHRLVGQSLADKVMDIQRVRSVLMRQAMDAMYFATAPRVAVNVDIEHDDTLADLLSIVPGAPVRYRGSLPPTPLQTPFAAPQAFQALEMMVGERESRTGITRLNQGLDADALNKTATGTALMQAQGQQIEEYLARNFAECLARLFAKKLRLMQRYGQPVSLRVGGEYKTIDPSALKGDMDLAINVGLGSGRKDQRLLHRMTVLQMQREAMASGLDIVGEAELYNSAAGYIADADLGDVNTFFKDPDAVDPETGHPVQKPVRKSPEEIEAEGKAAAEMARVEADREKAAAQIDIERMKAEAQIDMARAKAEAEAQLARDKAQFEADMARERAQAEYNLARENAAIDRSVKLQAYRPGGDLAA